MYLVVAMGPAQGIGCRILLDTSCLTNGVFKLQGGFFTITGYDSDRSRGWLGFLVRAFSENLAHALMRAFVPRDDVYALAECFPPNSALLPIFSLWLPP